MTVRMDVTDLCRCPEKQTGSRMESDSGGGTYVTNRARKFRFQVPLNRGTGNFGEMVGGIFRVDEHNEFIDAIISGLRMFRPGKRLQELLDLL